MATEPRRSSKKVDVTVIGLGNWGTSLAAGLAAALTNVGYSHAQLGDYQQARMFCRQALDLHREQRNVLVVAVNPPYE